MVGRMISHYRIVEKLAAGGMGVVYKAQDTKLGRSVALKFLPRELAKNQQAFRRLYREARTASALNHPNICTVHEIDNFAGRQFVVLEFIDGETLRDRIHGQPMAVAQALEIGSQLADALDCAHSEGIVHRDVKPANVLVTKRGQVKLLDFGLAKPVMTRGQVAKGAAAGSPRKAAREQVITAPGILIGTAAYMSPEQVRGEPLDARTDLFSLGTLLYEMCTGANPFAGSTLGVVFDAILNRAPAPLAAAIPDAPAELQRIIGKAIEKDRTLRYQSAAELRGDLRRLQRELESGLGMAGRTSPDTRVLAFQRMRITRVTTTGGARAAAISHDGKYVVHASEDAGQQSLRVRQVATGRDMQVIPPSGVEYLGVTFSADGNYIYFVRRPKDTTLAVLAEVPVLGGTARTLVSDVDSPAAASPDGRHIVFQRHYLSQEPEEDALFVVNVDGSNERRVAAHKSPVFVSAGPAWSPDGRAIAVAVGGRFRSSRSTVLALHLDAAKPEVISSDTWFSIRGIAWLPHGRAVIIVAADQPTGAPQLWELAYPGGSARRVTNDLNSYEGVSLTADGSALVTIQSLLKSDVWTARLGENIRTRRITSGSANDDGLKGVAWTPDGRLIYSSSTSGAQDLWIMDAAGRDPQQLTFGRFAVWPAVSPTGRFVLFSSGRTGKLNIWRMDIDGDGREPQQLTSGDSDLFAQISPDGRWVVYQSLRSGRMTIWKVSADGGEAVQLTREISNAPCISPDGQWIAFQSFEEQRSKHRIAIISMNGGAPVSTMDVPVQFIGRIGSSPFRWAPDGRALTYVNTRKGISNVWSQPLEGGPPKQLTKFTSGQIFSFAWSPDGNQLALARGHEMRDVVLLTDFM